MQYKGTLIAVKDIEKSKQFYNTVLGLKVIMDAGANAQLTGGVFLQTADTWADFIHKEKAEIIFGNNAVELYFETDDIDAFIENMKAFNNIHYLHSIVEHSWGQRAVRFYDLDNHIIEVAENIVMVIKRFIHSGLTVEQTAERMGVDVKIIEQIPTQSMNQEVQRRLAESLTFAGSTDIIPYLPYLLKDFWSLGSEPEEMVNLLHTHTKVSSDYRILDLACGKGAASIYLAKEFGCMAKGIDLMPEFIAEATVKAKEYGVSGQCDFVVGDVNDAITSERDYDLTIWGAAGDLLGSYPETLAGIACTVKSGGYILLDDGYIPSVHQSLRFHHNYLTKEQWEQVFQENDMTVMACKEAAQEVDPSAYADDLNNIRRRAEELIRQHPDKREMFENYVQSQQAEYKDLQDGMVPALWLLQKLIIQ